MRDPLHGWRPEELHRLARAVNTGNFDATLRRATGIAGLDGMDVSRPSRQIEGVSRLVDDGLAAKVSSGGAVERIARDHRRLQELASPGRGVVDSMAVLERLSIWADGRDVAAWSRRLSATGDALSGPALSFGDLVGIREATGLRIDQVLDIAEPDPDVVRRLDDIEVHERFEQVVADLGLDDLASQIAKELGVDPPPLVGDQPATDRSKVTGAVLVIAALGLAYSYFDLIGWDQRRLAEDLLPSVIAAIIAKACWHLGSTTSDDEG